MYRRVILFLEVCLLVCLTALLLHQKGVRWPITSPRPAVPRRLILTGAWGCDAMPGAARGQRWEMTFRPDHTAQTISRDAPRKTAPGQMTFDTLEDDTYSVRGDVLTVRRIGDPKSINVHEVTPPQSGGLQDRTSLIDIMVIDGTPATKTYRYRIDSDTLTLTPSHGPATVLKRAGP